MSVKATVKKGMGTSGTHATPVIDINTDSKEGALAFRKATQNAQEVNLDDPNSVDKLARDLGVESTTTVGTGDGAEPLTSPAPDMALATRPATSVPSPYGAESGGAIEGEFDMSDLKVPQLKLVNGSGELSQKYNQGTLLFADELLWLPPNLQPGAKNPSLVFIPVRIKKQFRENLTQDEVQEGMLPRVVSSRAEAEALGGSTQWVGNTKPRWSPSAACMFLIQEPEHQDRGDNDRHPGFSHTFDGKNWALGMYYAGGTAYSDTAKLIMSNAYTVLRVKGQIVLHKRLWTMQVTKKKAGNFSVFVPLMRLTREETGPEAVEFIQSITAGQGSAVE